MFGRSTGPFDRLVEKATSQLLLEPDWDAILQICDSVRQGDVVPKHAVLSLKKKIGQENPHVAMFALQALESVVKNCGNSIHQEVATKEFMEFMKDQVKVKGDPVKGKILELIQVWSHAFRNEPSYKIVQDTYNLMKMEGHTFPALKEADAMFASEKAPEWKDGECCHRCRVQFTMVQRKHHCRHCGQIFCNKCSSKQSIIPKFGIEREVRVCEACYDMINKPGKKDDELPAEYLASPLSKQSQQPGSAVPPSRTEQELQEEEELQLALALSQSEEEHKKEKSVKKSYSNYSSSKSETSSNATVTQPMITAPVIDTSDMDPELAKYLNRNYWEKKHEEHVTSTTEPTAPVASSESKTVNSAATYKMVESYQQNGETDDSPEQEEFLHALKRSIEIFVNRMKSNSLRGRSIANDSSVQTLFMTINAMHPQLMKYIGQQEDSRAHYEALQDKLAQLKDAREALDSLREEHAEKRRREAEEQERQRQIAMAQKLEVMRQKKQEYLEYQRQLAIQRMQEQQREMQMRLEQQKQMQQMRAMHYAYPQSFPTPGQTFSPAGSQEGSPHHQPHPGGPGYPQMTSMPPQSTAGVMPGQMAMGGQPGMPPQGPGFQPGFQPGPGHMMPGHQFQSLPPMGGPPSMATGLSTQGGTLPPTQEGQQVQPVSTGYQPPGGMVPPGQQSMPQMPPHSMAGMPPPQGPPQGYMGGPPPGDQAFNMQNMSHALPPQGQQQLGPPNQQAPGQPPQGQYMPPGQYSQAGSHPGPPEGAPQQMPPQQQQQQEASLISFD